MTTPNITFDHVDYGRGSQSLNMVAYALRSDNKRFRVRIHRDAYDNQSYAITECWTPNGWSEVTRELDFASMRVAKFSYVTKENDWRDAASSDARRLLARAMVLVP